MATYANFTWFQLSVYYFASFIGLAPFSVVNNNIRPVGFWRKAYAVILFGLSSLWILSSFLDQGLFEKDSSSTSSHRFVYGIYVTLFMGYFCSSMFILQIKSDKIVDVMNEITGIKKELKNLGVANDSVKYDTKFFCKIIATNSGVVLMTVTVNSLLGDLNLATKFSKTIFWIAHITTNIYRHSAILIFVETIICIRQLFQSLNNKLEGNVRQNRSCLPSDDQQNLSDFRLGGERQIPDQSARDIIMSENIQLSVGDVKKIGKLHSDIRILVESTTRLHTVPILLAILQHFCRLLSCGYALYVHVFISQYNSGTTDLYVKFPLKILLRTIVAILDIFLIANACTSMSRQANATRIKIHETWNEFYPEDLRDGLHKLSLQLLRKPVAVSAFGFFDLGYPYVWKIFCAVVTYLIIMIQL